MSLAALAAAALPDATGLALVAGVYAATYVLSAVVPAPSVPGYVIDPATGAPQVYRLTAFRVLLLATAGFLGAAAAGAVDAAVFHTHFASCAKASCALGLALSAFMYARGRRLLAAGRIDRRERCPTVDAPKGAPLTATADFDARGPATHFYAGLSEFNPSLGWGVDLKMWLYLVGAVQLQLNVLSTLAAAAAAAGGWAALNPAASAWGAMMLYFVTEYCFWEHVHAYTYDIFRERLGFKLVWGCTCFYPFFYAVGGLPLAGAAGGGPRLDPAAAGACVALFAAGHVLTRGANLQKFACKTGAAGGWARWVSMETLPGSGGRILVGGFWGVSRHVNYLGEVLQAAATALPAALAVGAVAPWAYPAYYVALFIPRAMDDDAQCAAKYGPALWGAYRARVPYRIVPGVW